MLNTERNTQAMEKRVRASAYAAKLGKRGHLHTAFEHGQWWVTNWYTGTQWSVVDTDTGFDFEKVTEGEEG